MFSQVDSRKDSMPNVVLSRAKRFDYEPAENSKVVREISPGPGAHGEGEGGFTKQRLSYKKSAAQFGFGTCERSGRDKMYLSVGHVKANYGLHSPARTTTSHLSPLTSTHSFVRSLE